MFRLLVVLFYMKVFAKNKSVKPFKKPAQKKQNRLKNFTILLSYQSKLITYTVPLDKVKVASLSQVPFPKSKTA